MKKLLFIAAAFVAGFSAMAQPKVDDVIKVNATTYDFGKIKQGVPVTTYFTITNATDQPVVIENAWAGCGCTTPEWSKEPIPAGGTSKLKVGYNAGAMGPFNKDVHVKLAGITETKDVKITGEVIDAASYDANAPSLTKATEVKTETKATVATPVADVKATTNATTKTKTKTKTKKSK